MVEQPNEDGDFEGAPPRVSASLSPSDRSNPGHIDGDRTGLTYTDQVPATPTVSITLTDDPPSAVWRELASDGDFQEALVAAALDAARGRTYLETHEILQKADVDVLHGSYRSLLLRTARGDEQALWDFLSTTRRLGTGQSPFEDILGAARLYTLALDNAPDRTPPTVEVRVTQAFREARADQRRDVCQLLAVLARGCDVRLVATGLVTRWLAREHRGELPGVSEARSTPTRHALVEERVAAAQEVLDVEGREVALLRGLTDTPAETHPYSAFYAEHSVSRSRVRQCLTQLQDLGLIDTYDNAEGKHAELLTAGRALIETLDREIGRQRRLDECVSGTGKPHQQCRVTPSEHGRGEDGPDEPAASSPPYRTEYLGRPGHHAAVAAARDGGVTLVDHPATAEETAEERRTRWVSYDPTREEAVVAVRATGPLQYAVSVATALASPRFFDRALPVSRLEKIEDSPAILRDARCIGALSAEAVKDAQVLRDTLIEWGERLAGLTTKLQNGEYEDRDQLRSEIIRSAHGLAGTVVHLLDVAGVDLTREVRIPGGLDREKDLAPLTKSLAISAAIQSRYGAFATYRQLFEPREEKRATALSPEVDAADPLGELIGGFVLRGPDLHRLEPALTAALRSPADVHEDAPEIAVPISLRTEVRRPTYADAVRRMCEAKNLDVTREAVSLLQGFTGSPHDAARALGGLETEGLRREIHPDEIRLALSELTADRVLPDAPPTVSRALHALLTASEPLTQTELADRAGITTRSVRTHTPRLEAFGLIEEVAGGYRLIIPFSGERHDTDAPLSWYLTPNSDREDLRDATEKGVIGEALYGHDLPGAEAVREAMLPMVTLQIPPDVRRGILETWPWAGPYLDAARALAADEPMASPDEGPRETITVGPELEQQPLTETGGPGLSA